MYEQKRMTQRAMHDDSPDDAGKQDTVLCDTQRSLAAATHEGTPPTPDAPCLPASAQLADLRRIAASMMETLEHTVRNTADVSGQPSEDESTRAFHALFGEKEAPVGALGKLSRILTKIAPVEHTLRNAESVTAAPPERTPLSPWEADLLRQYLTRYETATGAEDLQNNIPPPER